MALSNSQSLAVAKAADRVQRCLRTLFAVFLCATPVGLCSQTSPDNVRQTEALAHLLASKLSEADKKGVLVFDLYGPEEKWLPFGAWVADQFSTSLANLGQGIRVVDRARLNAALDAGHLLPRDERDLENAITLSRAAGANTMILGSYAAAENGIGVTLVAFHVSPDDISGSKSIMLGTSRGKITLTRDLYAHLNVPLSSLRPKDGIALAGFGGVTLPDCIKCTPPPLMSGRDIALGRFLQERRGAGTLQLEFIVTLEGRTTEITVSHPIGYGIDDVYVRAAKEFEFKPAVDADNKPVAVRTHLVFQINTK